MGSVPQATGPKAVKWAQRPRPAAQQNLLLEKLKIEFIKLHGIMWDIFQ